MNLKKDALINIVVNAFTTILNFIFVPFLAREISLEENGEYGQVLLVSNLLVLIFNLGILNIYPVLLNEFKNEINKVFSNTIYLLGLSSIIAILVQVVIGLFSILFLHSNIEEYLIIYSLFTVSTIFIGVITPQLIFEGKSSKLVLITLVFTTVRLLLSFLFIRVYHSVLYLVIVNTVINFLQAIALYLLVDKEKRKFTKFDSTIIKHIIAESYPFVILSFLGYSIVYIDGWMLSNLLSTAEYAIYRNGAIEIPFIATVYSSIAGLVMYKLAKLKSENEVAQMFQLKSKVVQTIAVFTFPVIIFFIINADYFIPLYLGAKYIQSAAVFSVFSAAALIRINNYGELLIINKNKKVIIYANLITFITNLIMNYFFIKNFGFIGAAFAYLISVFLLAGMLTYKTIKIYNVPLSAYFNFNILIKLSLVSILFSFGLKFLQGLNFYFYAITIAFVFALFYLAIIKFTNWIQTDLLPAQVLKYYKKLKPSA